MAGSVSIASGRPREVVSFELFRKCRIWEATNPNLAVVRLHGRNAETWDIKGRTVASDRFNYDYPDHELVATSIKHLSLGVDRVQVVFNNNYGDQGQRNATTLIEMLK